MTGLDCNILVQLAFADHPANSAMVAAVKSEVLQRNFLVIHPLVINEFLHVATDPKRFNPPLTMVEALDWIEAFTANSSVKVPDTAGVISLQMLQWIRKFNLGRKRILDTCTKRSLTSNPADFSVFGVFEIVSP